MSGQQERDAERAARDERLERAQRDAAIYTATSRLLEAPEVAGLGDLEALDAGELVAGLQEAESVTHGLLVMSETLSPATSAILAGAHKRAGEALDAAKRVAAS